MSNTWRYRGKALVQFLRANKAVPAGAVVIAAIMIFLAAKGNGWGSNHGLLSDSLLTVATLIVTYLIVDVVVESRNAQAEKSRDRGLISSLSPRINNCIQSVIARGDDIFSNHKTGRWRSEDLADLLSEVKTNLLPALSTALLAPSLTSVGSNRL